MNIIVNDKVIEIIPCRTFIQQVKSLNFIIEPIDYGILIPNKRFINTYMFCQKVDICVTNKEDKIIKLYENVKSEKIKCLWKKYNIYYLPLNTVRDLKVNEQLKKMK